MNLMRRHYPGSLVGNDSTAGIRSGRADARAGRPPYLYGVTFKREHRGELMKDALATVAILLLMGILLDSVCQWLILGTSCLGAALVAGLESRFSR